MRKDETSERLVPDLGHDVLLMNETNAFTTGLGCSDSEANYPLGARQWALQFGGPIDPPPDRVWTDLVKYHMG